MKPKYYPIEELLNKIDEPNRAICLKILEDNIELFRLVQGSSHNHQSWQGGYFDHIQEVMNIGFVLYEQLNLMRPLPFSLSDALLILFFHDIEKPWKYEVTDGNLQIKESLKDKKAQKEFRNKKIKEYGIELSEYQLNGMKYVEGEHDDYSPKQRVMNPLAAFCHLADVTSARIWFDYPVANNPWVNAKRSALDE